MEKKKINTSLIGQHMFFLRYSKVINQVDAKIIWKILIISAVSYILLMKQEAISYLMVLEISKLKVKYL